VKQRGQEGIAEEILAGDIGFGGAEALHVRLEAVAIAGIVVVP